MQQRPLPLAGVLPCPCRPAAPATPLMARAATEADKPKQQSSKSSKSSSNNKSSINDAQPQGDARLVRVQTMDYTTLLRVGGELRRRLLPGRVENAVQPDDYR